MAHIFKHKESDKLYTIEHLKVDLRFLNGGALLEYMQHLTSGKGKLSHIQNKITEMVKLKNLILKSLLLIISILSENYGSTCH
jgi:aromatic ring hydroxylase